MKRLTLVPNDNYSMKIELRYSVMIMDSDISYEIVVKCKRQTMAQVAENKYSKLELLFTCTCIEIKAG